MYSVFITEISSWKLLLDAQYYTKIPQIDYPNFEERSKVENIL